MFGRKSRQQRELEHGARAITDCLAQNGGRHNWGPLRNGESTCRTCGQGADGDNDAETMARMQALDRNDRRQFRE